MCEAWMFFNHIALMYYYRIYNALSEEKLLNKYSPVDVLDHLMLIQKLNIKSKWVTSEIPKKARELLAKFNVTIP